MTISDVLLTGAEVSIGGDSFEQDVQHAQPVEPPLAPPSEPPPEPTAAPSHSPGVAVAPLDAASAGAGDDCDGDDDLAFDWKMAYAQTPARTRYFYNVHSGQTSWTLPPDVPSHRVRTASNLQRLVLGVGHVQTKRGCNIMTRNLMTERWTARVTAHNDAGHSHPCHTFEFVAPGAPDPPVLEVAYHGVNDAEVTWRHVVGEAYHLEFWPKPQPLLKSVDAATEVDTTRSASLASAAVEKRARAHALSLDLPENGSLDERRRQLTWLRVDGDGETATRTMHAIIPAELIAEHGTDVVVSARNRLHGGDAATSDVVSLVPTPPAAPVLETTIDAMSGDGRLTWTQAIGCTYRVEFWPKAARERKMVRHLPAETCKHEMPRSRCRECAVALTTGNIMSAVASEQKKRRGSRDSRPRSTELTYVIDHTLIDDRGTEVIIVADSGINGVSETESNVGLIEPIVLEAPLEPRINVPRYDAFGDTTLSWTLAPGCTYNLELFAPDAVNGSGGGGGRLSRQVNALASSEQYNGSWKERGVLAFAISGSSRDSHSEQVREEGRRVVVESDSFSLATWSTVLAARAKLVIADSASSNMDTLRGNACLLFKGSHTYFEQARRAQAANAIAAVIVADERDIASDDEAAALGETASIPVLIVSRDAVTSIIAIASGGEPDIEITMEYEPGNGLQLATYFPLTSAPIMMSHRGLPSRQRSKA